MKRWIILMIFAGSVKLPAETNSMVTTNQVAITTEFLADLGRELREKQPAVAAARARVEAALAHAESIRTWEDPTLRSGVMAAGPSRTRADDGDFILGIEQKLPLFKKPQLARKVALTGRDLREAEAERITKLLGRELADRVYAAAFADSRVALLRQDLAWTETLAATMEVQFALGKVTQPELLRVQAERARRAEELVIAAQHRNHGRVEINRILNRPFHDVWPLLNMPPLFDELVDLKGLTDVALKFEPSLKVLNREAAVAHAEVAQVRVARKPNVTVGIDGRSRIETGEFRTATVYLNVNLPWWNRDKYAKDIDRAQAQARAVDLEVDTERLHVAEEIHFLVTEIDASRRTATVHRDEVIPRVEQALVSARNAWETGKGVFRDVLDARRMLVESQLAYASAVTEQQRHLITLALCCGIPSLDELRKFTRNPIKETQP
ncbi:MAG: TolC family protein [Pedosphaera sp.]|nr:TolC family protein [Pedosphaera sp.]